MNNVYYLEKTSSGSQQVSIKTKMLEKRIIFLDEQINRESVHKAIAQIALLAADAPGEPITMLISSPGGCILDGLVLIDVMQAYDGIIRTVSLGIAASMAAVILAAGTKGHRYITRHSQAMLHQPLISGSLPGGNLGEIEDIAQSLLERKQELDDLLQELTGRPESEIKKLTAKDTYLKADEAVRHGLADVIADGKTLNELIGGAEI